ncbi:MAG: DUF2313 domain-containing protein [Negativicutes bacterium]|nr:DUF2313 domain-containing protein [Negativicutes bacterium]
MGHNLLDYKPDYYDGILEMETLLGTVEQPAIDELWGDLNTLNASNPDSLPSRGVMDNQFIQTADAGKLTKLEALYNILADPTIETLDFRRTRLLNRASLQPPFSLPWLKQQLDKVLGAGQYTIILNSATYSFTVQAAAANQSYYQEILATIAYIKPCNMTFINQPLVVDQININEGVNFGRWEYNYHAGTTWNLGLLPFRSFTDRGNVIMPGSGSIQAALLADLATFTAGDVAKVRVNGSIIISVFDLKSAAAGVVTVEYEVTPAQTAEITLIELLRADNTVLTSSVVYIPVILGVQMDHTLTVKEGL